MEIDEIYEIIDSYEEIDEDYYNELLSIIVMLYFDDIPDFGILLKKAKTENKKVVIKNSEMEDCWDSLMISNLIIE